MFRQRVLPRLRDQYVSEIAQKQKAGVKEPLAPFSPLAWQKRTDRHHQQPLSA